MSKNILSQKVLEEEARAFSEHYKRAKQEELTVSLTERTAVFKKNEEASGF